MLFARNVRSIPLLGPAPLLRLFAIVWGIAITADTNLYLDRTAAQWQQHVLQLGQSGWMQQVVKRVVVWAVELLL